jgi:hypothetical protein
VERRVVRYLTLILPGWLAYNPRRGGGGVAWGQAGWPSCSYTGGPPYPRGGGVAVGGWEKENLERYQ